MGRKKTAEAYSSPYSVSICIYQIIVFIGRLAWWSDFDDLPLRLKTWPKMERRTLNCCVCVASVRVHTLVARICRSACAVAWRRRLPPYLELPWVCDGPYNSLRGKRVCVLVHMFGWTRRKTQVKRRKRLTIKNNNWVAKGNNWKTQKLTINTPPFFLRQSKCWIIYTVIFENIL